jgi:hypothetical protein
MATEELGTVTFGKGGEVIPLGGDNDTFEFPDEIETKQEVKTKGKPEVETSEVDIEIVDDTPPEDKGREPMEASPEDIDEDELNEYDKKVQKRLKKFSKGYHDERRAKEEAVKLREEAIRAAQVLVEENKKLQAQLHEGSKIFIEQGKNGAEAELNIAKKAYKEAYDSGDSDALVEAQLKISEATLRLDKARNMQPIEPRESQVRIPESAPQPPSQDEKLTKWLDENPWYGGDTPEEDEMTGLAITVHNRLAREFGEKYVGTDEYYEKINATIQKRFPDHFQEQEETQEVETKTPVKTRATKPAAAVVAPATRSVAPKKVQLTPTQVQLAKRLGVPLELYAKKVAEQKNGDR